MTIARPFFKMANFGPTDKQYTSKNYSDHTDYRFERKMFIFWQKKRILDRFCEKSSFLKANKNFDVDLFERKRKKS